VNPVLSPLSTRPTGIASRGHAPSPRADAIRAGAGGPTGVDIKRERHRRVSRLADEFYLICFEEQTGRSRVSEAVAGLGVAAGLLGELVLGGHLIVHEGDLYPAVGVPAPGDRLQQEVLQVLAGQHLHRDVGTWLRFLATDAVADVRSRLCSAGLLQRTRIRRLGVSWQERYLPVDLNAAAWPEIHLARQLCAGEPMPLSDAVLAGIVQATGLLKHVLWDPEHAAGWGYADRLRQVLPPAPGAVVAHVEAAVGQHILTRRGM
jgi:hypothetical protein